MTYADEARASGNSRISVEVEGGVSRLNLERQGEGIAAAGTNLGSPSWVNRRGYRATDRDSAPAAEGSIRLPSSGDFGGFSEQPRSMSERLAHETGPLEPSE